MSFQRNLICLCCSIQVSIEYIRGSGWEWENLLLEPSFRWPSALCWASLGLPSLIFLCPFLLSFPFLSPYLFFLFYFNLFSSLPSLSFSSLLLPFFLPHFFFFSFAPFISLLRFPTIFFPIFLSSTLPLSLLSHLHLWFSLSFSHH